MTGTNEAQIGLEARVEPEVAQDIEEQTGEEVRVEVNQRALIDKVLARYSGEFSLFRELLQNADDARSSAAEIHFETEGYREGAANTPVPMGSNTGFGDVKIVQWTFKNDGRPFRTKDWERLPRIAEGNPHPDKIGAFGVGFYTLFSVTENPCVSSGGREMRFYWKDNDSQLYARSCILQSDGTPDRWTTFAMPLRDPGPIPRLLDFMQFLASSITFTVNLKTVAVYHDGHRVGYIKKSQEPSQTVNVPNEIKRSSPENIMSVKGAQCYRMAIETEITSMYARSEARNPSAETSASRVDLTVFSAEVNVMVDEKISGELQRCMKKKPPSRLKYSLIYTGKDEYDRNSKEKQDHRNEEEAVAIFQGLRADLEGAKHTRIFIGHATGQTTGIGGHMASRFIPTVEREAIDFVDSYVSVWNKELLYVGGLLCRAVYELELSDIQRLWEDAATGTKNAKPSSESQDHLHSRFLHLLKFFAFHHSTPSTKVSEIVHSSFYACSDRPLQLLSSIGVRAAPSIKVYDRHVAKFLETLPMLPERVGLEAARNITALPESQKILQVTVQEVLQALHGYPINEKQLVSCLEWWFGLRKNDSGLDATELLPAIAYTDADGNVHSLSQKRCFIDGKDLGVHIPCDGPLPTTLVPLNISKHFKSEELTTLGWTALTIFDWFEYISRADVISKDSTYDFTKSPDWAERVLYTLSRAWSSPTNEMRRAVRVVFESADCIPTSHGLHRPDSSYLPTANDTLFRRLGLPVVAFTDRSKVDAGLSKLLSFLGVRKHIPLDRLSDQMLDTGEWSVSRFVDYLVRDSPPLTEEQISKLKSSRIFFGKCFKTDKRRYCANELYPPVEAFDQLELPVIDWDPVLKWSDESDGAELLYRLGLNPHPPLQVIIGLCTSPNASLGKTAFRYFCENYRSNYSGCNLKDFAFVPAEDKDGTCLKPPGEVFLGTQWKELGFSIVPKDLLKVIISELGIRQHPPPPMLLDLLEKTRPSEQTARRWYECFSECIQDFTQPQLTRLSELQIVPTSSSGALDWLAPTQCYLGQPTDKFYSELFVFVDFGTRANHFLSHCGSMKEPSVKHVAESLIGDPDRFFELAEKHGGFLEKLRDLATRKAYIPNETLKRMSSLRTLLGERREQATEKAGCKSIKTLLTPKEIVIVDDSRDYALFRDTVFVAPQDELLERFYSLMGCRRLSTVIHERYEDSPEILDAQAGSACSEVQNLILERLPLFLRKCSNSPYDETRVPRSNNFSVMFCERLRVHKTLTIGDDNTSREQDLWATTKHDKDKGKIELWLSRHVKQDMYDLAASLCRLLFGTVNINDTLLLGTMLSDLELLKRAGFNVDQFSEQQAPEDRSAQVGAIMNVDPCSSSNLTVNQGSPSYSTFGYIRHSIIDTLDGARSAAYRMVKGGLTSTTQPSATSDSTTSFLPLRTPCRVVSQDVIRDAVSLAIEASNSKGSHLLDDKEDKLRFLGHQSCNDFSQIKQFQSIGICEGLELHVAEGLPDIDTFAAARQNPLIRFVRIITPVASAHKLSIRSLHVFYDAGDGPIACNWERDIYLNLRYFEAWHDEDVKNGRLRRAQLSWFFIVAHEVAHNLIPSHDSAHEFWFSAICEANISDLFAASGSASDSDL